MSTVFINIADLVNPSDPQRRTYREINAVKTHAIQIGALVEIIASEDDDSFDGVRLYVVHHGRDCDQTPLYYMCPDRYDTEQQESRFKNRTWTGGFSEDSLRMIAPPKEANA